MSRKMPGIPVTPIAAIIARGSHSRAIAAVVRFRRSMYGALLSVCALLAPVHPSLAADYPDRPIHLIVPFPAGSSVDMVARPLAQGLTTVLGQEIVVDNHPGAGAIVGTAIVARAKPDGYTMLLAAGAHTSQASLSKLPYDPIRDFAPITQVAASCGLVLLANTQLEATTVRELVALAKKTPGKLSYATLGYGSSTHVAGALFAKSAGIDLIGVPYASPNLINDFVAGRVDMAFISTVSAAAPVQTGHVRPLAVTGPRRCESFPSTPTLKELGYREFDREGYFGLAFPAGTPPAYVDRIYKATVIVLKTPDMGRAMHADGLRSVGSTPQEFDSLLRDDLKKEAEIIKRIGITKD